MTVKSNCELDVRIKSTDDIQTCLRYNEEFIGCKGYFFDDLVKATDLSKCAYGTLLNVDNTDHVTDFCFKAELKSGNRTFFRFFIPEKLLKPVKKKYRQYTPNEWKNNYNVGQWIHYRRENFEYTLLYLGFKETTEFFEVNIGGKWYILYELFTRFEEKVLDEWKPFGVEVEDE